VGESLPLKKKVREDALVKKNRHRTDAARGLRWMFAPVA